MGSRKHNHIASTVHIGMTRVLQHILSERCAPISELRIFATNI